MISQRLPRRRNLIDQSARLLLSNIFASRKAKLFLFSFHFISFFTVYLFFLPFIISFFFFGFCQGNTFKLVKSIAQSQNKTQAQLTGEKPKTNLDKPSDKRPHSFPLFLTASPRLFRTT